MVKFDSVTQVLEHALEIHADRDYTYNKSYRQSGDLYAVLFPNGVRLETPEDFGTFTALTNVIMKLHRFCRNLDHGGHLDSALDMTNYSAILAYKCSKSIEKKES